MAGKEWSLLFRPLILTTNLILLLGSKVVLDVERLTNLLGRFTLDHVGDRLAANIQKSLDVEIVGSLFVNQRVSLRSWAS